MPPNLSVEEAEALRALARNYVEGRRWACRLWRMLAWIGGGGGSGGGAGSAGANGGPGGAGAAGVIILPYTITVPPSSHVVMLA